jgi:mono/diheme cytochrome c family protein
MKLRHILPLIFVSILLAACNMTLAEDITPPPDYIAPTPVPTLVLYPSQKPSVANGERIYAEKCAACHGLTGLGDGEQGIQLGVTVRAFGLAEIARPASPAQYYTAVTRGNIERFMPPFASLNDQERWDVTAYVLALHTSPEEIERGKQLFESNCKDCSTDYFENQQTMSELTAVELARIAKQGNDQIPAFGADFDDDDLWAVAAYMRTLSFDSSPLATPEPASVDPTPVSAAGTPVATSQAAAGGEATSVPQKGFGTVSGSVENKTGASLPSDLSVTLRAFEHDANDPNAGPVEITSLTGTINSDGTFLFENIEMPTDRIFLAEVTFDGVPLQSGFGIVEEGAQALTLPALALYPTTQDASILQMDDVQIIFEFSEEAVQVYSLYSFRNASEETLVVSLSEIGEISFVEFPANASGFGYEPTQDSAKYIPLENGFAIPPSETPYGLIAVASLPNTGQINFSQGFVLPIALVTVYAPEGVKIATSTMTDFGVQTIQEFRYHVYQNDAVNAGESLVFTLSSDSESTASAASNPGLLIGIAALGLALIGAGAWIYRQDRQTPSKEERGNEFESADEIMDAIIALDDLHGMKRISEKAYKKRRAELKEILRNEIRE